MKEVALPILTVTRAFLLIDFSKILALTLMKPRIDPCLLDLLGPHHLMLLIKKNTTKGVTSSKKAMIPHILPPLLVACFPRSLHSSMASY